MVRVLVWRRRFGSCCGCSASDWERAGLDGADGWLPGRWLSGVEGVVVDPRAGPRSCGDGSRAPASAEPQQARIPAQRASAAAERKARTAELGARQRLVSDLSRDFNTMLSQLRPAPWIQSATKANGRTTWRLADGRTLDDLRHDRVLRGEADVELSMGRGTWSWIVPDGLWEIAKPLIPPSRVRPQGGGTQDTPDETLFAAIIYVLVSAAPGANCHPASGYRSRPPTAGS